MNKFQQSVAALVKSAAGNPNVYLALREMGYVFRRKIRDYILKNYPDFEGEVTGDLASIFEPIGTWTFPSQEDSHFGVQNPPISFKLAMLNIYRNGIKPELMIPDEEHNEDLEDE